MTREEAIENLKLIRLNAGMTGAKSFKEALDLAIVSLSQPSIPSDLDEAAHSYAWKKQEHHIDFDGDEYLDYGPRYSAFKAGAETIERACKWLFAHLPILVDYYNEDIHENADKSEFIKLFRKQIEEE